MAEPFNGNVNCSFTIEGEQAFQASIVFLEWLQALSREYNVDIRQVRQDYHDKDNPQNRLGKAVVDKVYPSEAAKGPEPFKVKTGEKKMEFKGGKDGRKDNADTAG